MCAVAAICALSLGGCGQSRPDLAAVTGKVTYQGRRR